VASLFELPVPSEGLTFLKLFCDIELGLALYLVDMLVGDPSTFTGPLSEKTVAALKFLANLELPCELNPSILVIF